MSESVQRSWNWYSRESVQRAILEIAKNREVVSVFADSKFGKRPDVLNYPGDILQAVGQGTISFHGSVERWQQPMKLDVGQPKTELDALRIGWDVFIDPDVENFEIGKIVTKQIIEAFKDHGVSSYSIKYTGGKGFHIGIPFESLPEKINMQSTALLYPDMLQKIIEYLKHYIEDMLREELMALATPAEISQKVNKPLNDIVGKNGLDPFKIVSMDIFSSRHLFRLPYSVDYAEPILIKNGNTVKIMQIGEFVDNFFNVNENIQTYNISNLCYETLSVSKNLKVRFGKIKEVIRHYANEDAIQIKLETGRKVKITSGHSIFILKNGKIETIKGNEIRIGDYIIVPRELGSIQLLKDGNALYLSEELIEVLDKHEKKIVFLCNFDSSLFKKIYGEKTKRLLKERYKNVYNWKAYNILPLDVYEELRNENIISKEDFKNADIKACHHGGKTISVPNKIIIDKKFFRLLGYYTSEGSCEMGNRHRISFSFGTHEKELIEDCLSIIENKFKIKATKNNPNPSATQLVFGSVIFTFFLTKLLKCGKIAHAKRVPKFVWIAENDLKLEYLRGFLLGDGSKDKKWSKNIGSTVSKWLFYDLTYLANMLGLNYLAEEGDTVSFFKKKKSHVYYLKISGKEDVERLGFKSPVKNEKQPLIRLFPIKELGLEKIILNSSQKNQYLKNKFIRRKKEQILSLIHNFPEIKTDVLKILNSNLAFLKVVDIQEVKSSSKYFYDLSINDDENFIAGIPILLHNSLHEKTFLVSLPLRLEALDKFEREDAVPEKVKVEERFLTPKAVHDAEPLIIEALDWASKHVIEVKQELPRMKVRQTRMVSEEYFPPCVHNTLKGLTDGKKRSVFVLINFLRNMGWDIDKMEKKLVEWNQKNYPPLRNNYLRSQLRWHTRQEKSLLPPNCDNPNFYTNYKVCTPDEICRGGTDKITIKNPVSYPFRKMKRTGKRKRKKM